MTKLVIDGDLVVEIKQMIQDAKQRVTVAVNAEMTLLYWHVGKRIAVDVLKGGRAGYGKQVFTYLANHLTVQFGKGWTARNLAYMVKFAECFPDQNILHAVSAKLSWTHFRQLIGIQDSLKRDFYLQMAELESWSTRTLAERIDSQLFERTAISRKPHEIIAMELDMLREKGEVNENLILKDPYVLDFLGLTDHYMEKDLEDAILRELEQFLLELGSGFSFVARQKRIQVDGGARQFCEISLSGPFT